MSAQKPTSPQRLWARLRPESPSIPWHLALAASAAGGLTIAVLGLAGDLAGTPILIAAFGSSCVLVFLMPDAALSQPVNVIGGHLVAALCGVAVHALLPVAWWSLGLAVGVAMAAMAAARVIHPPAGGTPIAIMMTHAGWGYLFTPVLVGAVILSACALGYRMLLKRFAAAQGAGAATTPAAD
jgi:CBS-domain-containing membrane protein